VEIGQVAHMSALQGVRLLLGESRSVWPQDEQSDRKSVQFHAHSMPPSDSRNKPRNKICP
jgi:hypothetical protein